MGTQEDCSTTTIFRRPSCKEQFSDGHSAVNSDLGDVRKMHRYVIAIAALLLISFVRPSLAQVAGEHYQISSAHPVAAIQDTETAAQRDARMSWWREARLDRKSTRLNSS